MNRQVQPDDLSLHTTAAPRACFMVRNQTMPNDWPHGNGGTTMALSFNLDLSTTRFMHSAPQRAVILAHRGLQPACAPLSVGIDASIRLHMALRPENCRNAGLHANWHDVPAVATTDA
ncbi:hypothetical protein D3W54_15400 [Komagataeibacter medellinensis]|uniref:Uncharacterized protein n=1 Tax=Komagataeibacter medellinensis TaxID=1177712 RepID=A0ABQ6VRI4_9PROT|nr:hypothetical protein [Komagataeibacter medellinensis]KAB8122556.1 hypothetical protein D3W54_15400 [Komagataeibacter medellinensis]